METTELSMSKQTRVFIATPMFGGQCSGFYAQGILALQGIFAQKGVQAMHSFMHNESLIPRARNSMAKAFLKSACTHLFFIDADIAFDASQAYAMLLADKDIIGGIYPKKEINWQTVSEAAKAGVPPDQLQNYSGSWVVNLANYAQSVSCSIGEPLEVNNIGTGFMLIKREAFEALIPHVERYNNDVNDMAGSIGLGEEIFNFFALSIEPGTNRLLSEDYHFCRTWREHGGKIWAAPWVQLAHVGAHVFNGKFLPAPVPSPPAPQG